MIQVLVSLSESAYKEMCENGVDNVDYDIRQMMKNGTSLPKAHGRIFEEIVVQYPPAELCTYPEYRGKPYFSIKYEENGEHFIGFGTYKPEVLSRYLREYFITPPIIEADKDYEAEVITRGNCMMCGKELTEGLFFCKECEDKANRTEREDKG